MYPTKEELIERYKIACEMRQPINLSKIQEHMDSNYKALGIKPKKITALGSLKEFYDRKENLNLWDSTWSSSLCIGAMTLNKGDMEKVMSIYFPIFLAMESGLWLYAYHQDGLICLPNPELKLLNNRLHCTDGPAFKLPGDELYYLNGVWVTKELVMTPAEKLDPHILLKEKNAEVRREIVRKIGIERIVLKIGGKSLDKQGDYELLNLDLGDGRQRPYLKMKNQSIKTWHLEGVPPEIKTVQAALFWRNQTDVTPEVLT